MRLLSMIIKEFLAIKNDKKTLFVVLIPPLIQVIVFSFAATLQVKNIDVALFSKGASKASQNLEIKLASTTFVNLTVVHSFKEGKELINNQKVIAFMVVPKDMSQFQIILDGRRSNTAQMAESYLTSILENVQGVTSNFNITQRNFYNPNLMNFWWIVPSLFGSISMVIAIILTSLSISREREMGTFEQILVSPLNNFEILLGKLIPALIIGMFEMGIIFNLALFAYDIPFNGSFAILFAGSFLFLLSISGVGLFISAVSKTQQQAILGDFIFMLPSFLLSGFATPIENMPQWLQPISDFFPLTYFLIIIKGTFLKDISLDTALHSLIPMLILGVLFLAIAMIFFKKRTD